MIDLIFAYFNETILIKIDGCKVLFGNSSFGNKMTTIDGLKLSQSGVLKEFPDLKNNNNWRSEAIKRFQWKINDLMDEEKIADYLINDLVKFGYIPKFKQIPGYRPERIQWDGQTQ